MIGIIVTGHGNFATGITSAVNLIAGKQQDYESVDFASLDNTDMLSQHLKEALDKLSHCEGIIVFADLLGGSPFKMAVELAYGKPDIAVLAGTNLGEVIEISMLRTMENDFETLVSKATETGKAQHVRFVMPESIDNEDPGDGI